MSQIPNTPEYKKSALEALLFVARRPLTRKQLSDILDTSENEIAELLVTLKEDLKARGIQVAALTGGYILATRAEFKEVLDRLSLQPVEVTLSPAALETLAIVAYRQPLTRQEIEMIRGVDSAGVLDTLLLKGFLRELGRKDVAGRPILYGSTDAFLRHFGLKDLNDLPPLEDQSERAPLKLEHWFGERAEAAHAITQTPLQSPSP